MFCRASQPTASLCSYPFRSLIPLPASCGASQSSSWQGRGDFSRGIRGWSLNGYGQDTYKVSRRVTLNYGLRYELPTPYTEIHNRQTLWIPGRQSTVMPSAPADLLYPGDKGVPAGLIPTDKKAFAPRIGIAIDPTGNGSWLLTGAYGMYYEPYY